MVVCAKARGLISLRAFALPGPPGVWRPQPPTLLQAAETMKWTPVRPPYATLAREFADASASLPSSVFPSSLSVLLIKPAASFIQTPRPGA